ncbi:MAG: protein kinase [Gemmataceae bacterium]|nr:protein kinase [Gemmataceae bacterium]
MGVVYKARQLGLNRIVALKMILAREHADREQLARFRGEAEAIGRLQHPHIVQIHAIGEHQGQPYFSLEFVEGGSLADRLKGAPQPPRPSAELVERLARAMHAAHQLGIIHRDLKPANVLLLDAPPGSDTGLGVGVFGIPKITDFGLAKNLDANLDAQEQTQTGAVMGTPSYMAPEQAASQKDRLGPPTDVYALGAILYELLTGRPPFRGASVWETIRQVQHQEPVRPRLLQPQVPLDVETICLKCLEKEPRNRYPSAEALADDLRRFRNGEPILARPIGAGERLWRWAKRNTALAASGLVAALAVLATLATLSVAVVVVGRSRDQAFELAGEKAKLAQREGELRQQAERDAAQLRFQGAYHRCVQDGAPTGILWLADALAKTPEDAADVERDIRVQLAAWSRSVYPLYAIGLDQKTLAFSLDGRSLLTAGNDRTVQLRDAASGQPVGKPLVHDKEVAMAALSADGRTAFTAAGATGHLWETGTGRPLGPPLQHENPIVAATFRSEQTLLTLSKVGQLREWNVQACTVRSAADLRPGDSVHLAAFNWDATKVAVALMNKPVVKVWDVAQRQSLAVSDVFEVADHPAINSFNSITALAFARDATPALIIAFHNGRLQRWDVSRRQSEGLADLDVPIDAIAVCPNGRILGGGCNWNEVAVWDSVSGKALRWPMPQPGSARVAFSTNGEVLAFGDPSGTLWLRRLHTLAAGSILVKPPVYPLVAAALSPDGAQALLGTSNGVAVLADAATGIAQPADRWLRHSPPFVAALAFSADGNTVATGGIDSVILWDAGSGKPLGEPLRHDAMLSGVVFSPDGKALVTSRRDGMVQQWDIATRQKIGAPMSHNHQVWIPALNPDGKTVLVPCGDGTAPVWDLAAGKRIGEPLRLPDRGKPSGFKAAAWSADGKRAATGSYDGRLDIWDMTSRQPVGPPLLHPKMIYAVAFSPDGRAVLTGCDDGMARLWDVGARKLIGEPLRHRSRVIGVAFSSDGKRILTASQNGAVALSMGPMPVLGEPARIMLWAQVITGLELDGSGGTRRLDATTWQARRDELHKLGGPPHLP